MPHVIVKVWLEKSEQQKRRLGDAIAKDVMNVTTIKLYYLRKVAYVSGARKHCFSVSSSLGVINSIA